MSEPHEPYSVPASPGQAKLPRRERGCFISGGDDRDAKIMLLWAGIEGLLGMGAELHRRIALHAVLFYDGSTQEKAAYFRWIKKDYDVRSRVVHSAGISADALSAGFQLAAEVLLGLLRKAVILGRVRAAAELDALAAGISIPSSDPGKRAWHGDRSSNRLSPKMSRLPGGVRNTAACQRGLPL